MVKSIRIENFRGIDNIKEISFIANPKRKSDKLGVRKIRGQEILLSVALMGKNGSGKTSFIDGIDFICRFVTGAFHDEILFNFRRSSSKTRHFLKSGEKTIIKYVDNKIKEGINSKIVMDYIRKKEFNDPTKAMNFQIEFVDPQNLIKMDITILTNGIVEETIYKNNEIFVNWKTDIQKFSSKIFDENLNFDRINFQKINYLDSEFFEFWIDPITFQQLNKHGKKSFNKMRILRWIQIADSKIRKIVWTSKNVIEGFIIFNENGSKMISPSELSTGTRKWIQIGFKFFESLFINKSFIFIDEIENSIHPSLVKFLILIINDNKINTKKSQLLFTSHSPFTVDIPFRKDAINYIDNVSKVVNLGKLGLREDINFSKNYINEKLSSHPTKSDMYEFIKDFYA